MVRTACTAAPAVPTAGPVSARTSMIWDATHPAATRNRSRSLSFSIVTKGMFRRTRKAGNCTRRHRQDPHARRPEMRSTFTISNGNYMENKRAHARLPGTISADRPEEESGPQVQNRETRMRAVREPPAYRYVRSAGYAGGMNRLNGPVRRSFAFLAIACAVVVAAAIVGVALLGQALAGGGGS